MSVSEIIVHVLGYEISCNHLPDKKKVTSKLPIIQLSAVAEPLSFPPFAFHAIPLQALFLAMLHARPKQFSNKLFAFVGIHFQLFLHFPFVVGSDCLSEFPHSLRE